MNLTKKSSYGVLILAGGESKRMRFPKPFLKIGNKTFLEKIISAYLTAKTDKIIVVLNKNISSSLLMHYFIHPDVTGVLPMGKGGEFNNYKIVMNSFPESGRFYSIKLGMKEMKDVDFCFIQNVDNPFVDERLFEMIKENRDPDGYTLPVYKGKGGHPVLISKKIISAINKTESIDTNLRDFLNDYNRTEVKVRSDEILININTKIDYKFHIKDCFLACFWKFTDTS